MAALNSSQFKGPLYHGTSFDLTGKDIVPANRSGNSVWQDHGHSGQRSSNHAFATESEATAWTFAGQAGVTARAKQHLGEGPEAGRVRVHEVAPNPSMRPGVYHRDNPNFDAGPDGTAVDLKEWVAPAFRSKGTIDTKPGRQGTFPDLNWNQFADKKLGYLADTNHPTDLDIEHGHTSKGNRFVDPGSDRTPAPSKKIPYDQPDLLSGKTVGWHAENDPSEVGDYHRNNLFGKHL